MPIWRIKFIFLRHAPGKSIGKTEIAVPRARLNTGHWSALGLVRVGWARCDTEVMS
jgi:hypothetical protein